VHPADEPDLCRSYAIGVVDTVTAA